MAGLALSLLGPLRVTLDDQPVTGLAYDKVRALLAYLVVEALPHRRDALAELLWPGQRAVAARRSLRVALTTLRQAIGDRTAPVPFLLVAREIVQVNPARAVTLDVATFIDLLHPIVQHAHDAGVLCPACAARLTQAVALYHGDFLQPVVVRESAAFDEWVTLTRERLHHAALAALAELAAYHESRGEDDQARQYGWRQLALEPWDESAHRCVMRVLARKGQRSAALAQYERCCQVLAAELGIEPSGETTALYEQIRTSALARIVGSRLVHTPATGLGNDRTNGSGNGSTILSSQQNLPAQLTPFIGREAELANLAQLLADPTCRLLTVVGAGGSGKTRLALQAARGQIGAHLHGVYFVSLTSTSSPDFLVSAIADSLSFPFYGPQDPNMQLLNYLREKEMLLVLDNFEHLLDGTGLLVDILTSAPAVKLLVTSRERLKLHGEWVYEIQGLAVPEAKDTARLEEYSAAQLFLQSARRAQTDFSLSEEKKIAVVRLCQLVEGMPLALELAATWVRMLSCEEIVKELAQSLGFLTTSLHHMPDRHRSIRAVFDHSWNLLSYEERNVFRRLSVFQGGFRREAAERVTSTSLPLLAALVDKSLLRWNRVGRYQMHELLRQYAAEKLEETPAEKEMAQSSHGRYYLAFLWQQEERLKGSRQKQALAEIRAEIDNIRLACQRAIAQEWAKEMGRAAQSFLLFYDTQGWYHEAEAIFRQAAEALAGERGTRSGGAAPTGGLAQEHVEAERERGIGLAQVLGQQGWFLLRLGLIGKAKELFQQSVALLRRFGARAELADILQFFSMVIWVSGDYQEAQLILQEGLTIFRERESHWSIAICLCCLGNVAKLLGNDAEAKHLLRQSLALFKEIGDSRLTAMVLNYLGPVAYTLGEYTEAKQWLQESLTLSREIDDRWSMALCFNQLGAITYQGGAAEWPEAKRLHEESLAISKELGDRREIAVSLNYLGYVTCALGDYPAAKQHFLAALQTATEDEVPPLALDALVGLATLLGHQPAEEPAPGMARRKAGAVELLALVLTHPASSQEIKDKAQRLQAELAADLPPQVVAAAQASGQARKLAEVVAEIVAEKRPVLFS
ncbi:MAG: BTAD domain-containing putative transcriptional regulator [Roseiflexaceae bacterium]